jgi:hypothetical protein
MNNLTDKEIDDLKRLSTQLREATEDPVRVRNLSYRMHNILTDAEERVIIVLEGHQLFNVADTKTDLKRVIQRSQETGNPLWDQIAADEIVNYFKGAIPQLFWEDE